MSAIQAQLDLAARQKGFQNYAQYQAWDAHRQDVLHGPTGTAPAPQASPQQEAPTNWLQTLLGGLNPLNWSAHHVTSALNSANNRANR